MEYGKQIDIDAEKVLRFQHERIVKNLFVSFLVIVEDLARRHDIALDKLDQNLPEEYKKYVELADYLDDPAYQLIRKRVLDNGNKALAELDNITQQFNITIK